MPEFTKTVINPNWELLIEEIQATYPNMVYQTYPRRTPDPQEIRVVDDSLDETTLDAILSAHNPSALTDAQEIDNARDIALAQGKAYLRRQMKLANPNINDIYDTLTSHVASDTTLTQMVDNQVSINSNCYGWILNLITPTALDKQRYIKSVQDIIALLT